MGLLPVDDEAHLLDEPQGHLEVGRTLHLRPAQDEDVVKVEDDPLALSHFLSNIVRTVKIQGARQRPKGRTRY